MRIALIPTLGRGDTLEETICDGLVQMEHAGTAEFALASEVEERMHLEDHILPSERFASFAREADIILLFYGKKKTNDALVDSLGLWNKTIFVDGSEVGKNNRLDPKLMQAVHDGRYTEYGGIRDDIREKAALYFRREKPYRDGIIPLPFGIETAYIRWNPDVPKDLDFVCVFGQDEFPPLRRQVRDELIRFCSANGFSCHAEPTATPDEFRRLLARAKVGISVGGGGFDTLRFWEILGNNCLLLTESIDIYRPEDHALEYSRIRQFGNVDSFRTQLADVGDFLRSQYRVDDLADEYADILATHSSVARVQSVLREAHRLSIF